MRRQKKETQQDAERERGASVQRREAHRQAVQAAKKRGVAYDPANRANYAFREVDQYRARQNALGTPGYGRASVGASAAGSGATTTR